MSVNINADTTNGLVLTSDTSGELKLQSAGTDIATVSSTGIAMATGKGLSGDASSLTNIPAANLTGSLPAGMGGKILQVQYTQLTSTYSQAVTIGTNTALTNIDVDITPTSTSSKILIQVSWFGEFSQPDDIYDSTFFLYRNTTKLSHPAAGSRNVGITGAALSYWTNNAASTCETMNLQYIDTPNTTSAITYKLGIYTFRGGTIYTNRTVSDTNSGNHERGITSIIATEIGA